MPLDHRMCLPWAAGSRSDVAPGLIALHAALELPFRNSIPEWQSLPSTLGLKFYLHQSGWSNRVGLANPSKHMCFKYST